MSFLIKVLAILTLTMGIAQAQQYPDKPVRIIYPYNPGAGTPALYMALAEYLSKVLGQRVFIETKPGANATIGTNLVAKSAPDGYTLLATFDDLATKPLLYRKLPYDTFKDLTPVTGVGRFYFTLAVGPSLPAKNLKELAGIARAKPGVVSYASVGLGSWQHLSTEMLAKQLGIQLNHIVCRGTAPALAEVVAGSVDMMFATVAGVTGNVRGGKVRIIATTGETRTSQYPDVPTLSESGMTGFSSPQWSALHAPAGTPQVVIEKIHEAIGKVLSNPEFRSKYFEPLAWEPLIATSAQLAAMQEADFNKYREVVRELNIPPFD